jgi:adenylate cyclase
LVACQWLSGRHDEARQTVTQLLALDPTMTVTRYLRAHPAGETKFGRLAAEPLRLAGVPA